LANRIRLILQEGRSAAARRRAGAIEQVAKQLVGKSRFQVPGGQATPAPPVGTSLGKYGINLGQFVQQFNERTREYAGTPIPVIVSVYSDRSFDFVTKSPPAASLLKQAARIAKGSGTPNKAKVGVVTRAQIDEICRQKMADLNARDLDHARRMIEGTAQSMGLEVTQ
jgi:large subunit ribosomal protein L11